MSLRTAALCCSGWFCSQRRVAARRLRRRRSVQPGAWQLGVSFGVLQTRQIECNTLSRLTVSVPRYNDRSDLRGTLYNVGRDDEPTSGLAEGVPLRGSGRIPGRVKTVWRYAGRPIFLGAGENQKSKSTNRMPARIKKNSAAAISRKYCSCVTGLSRKLNQDIPRSYTPPDPLRA